MTRVHLCIASALLAAALFPADVPAQSRRRLALVIGNQNYRYEPKLTTPLADAGGMAAALKESGFITELRTDLDLISFRNAVNDFSSRVRENDEVLFYYAGHGAEELGRNYLLPVDFQGQSEAEGSSVPIDSVLRLLRARKPQVKIIVLDACRTLVRGKGGLAEVRGGRGEYVAFASAPGRPALDNMFTRHLIDVLRTPGLNINDVFDAVRERVDRDTQGAQVPWSNTGLIGAFYFRREGQVSRVRSAESPRSSERNLPERPKLSETLRGTGGGGCPGVTGSASGEGDSYRRAQCAFDEGQYSDAVKLLNAAIRANDGNPEYYQLRGRTHVKLSQPPLAEADFRRAIELQPDLADPYFELGHLQSAAGNIDEASRSLLKAYELAPNRDDICLDLANVLDKKGLRREAAELRLKASAPK